MLGIEVGGDELVLEELGEQMMVKDREDVRLPVSVVETSSQSIQVPEIPRRAYKEAEERTQQKMRAKAIDNLSALANQFVNFIPSDVPSFICDLVHSGKWQSTFGSVPGCNSAGNENSFLSTLAAEYQACKDKELNKAIRKNAASQTQRILIGDTLKKSRISFSGNTPEIFNSRVDAAKQLGRLRTYSDEKRRLLSIVAMDYP